MTPFITFTSDFGQKDVYVASVKAVILSRLPNAVILDVTHEITPFRPLFALPPLIEILEVTPPHRIHLVIVDPGVGSDRRALVGVSPTHQFVFPDNGLPATLLRWVGDMRFFHLDDPRIFGGFASPTFQGRDLFAPAVAELGKGRRPEEMGREVPSSSLFQDPSGRPDESGKCLVWNIDRFGNVLLGFRAIQPPEEVSVEWNGFLLPYVRRYQEVPIGHLGLLFNSSRWLEIFCREGSASEQTGIHIGTFLKIRIRGGTGQTLT